MNLSTTVDEYRNNEYKLCPSNRDFFVSWQSMAYTSHFLLVFCLPFHLFGGYCIIKKTPLVMKNMKWSLFNLQFWCSFFDISLNSLVTPYLLLPTISGFPIGIFQVIGVPVAVQTYFGLVVFFAMFFSICMSFHNRAEVLPSNRFKFSTTRSKIVFCAFNATLFFVWTIFLFALIPEQESGKLRVLRRYPCPIVEFFEAPVFVLLVDREYASYMNISCGSLLFFIVAETLFFLCCCVYYLYFSVNVNLSKKTRELQLRCFLSILAQVSIPFIFLIPPFVIMWKSFLIAGYSQSITNIGVTIASLHGFISTIVVLLTHHPYREYVLSFFTSKKHLTTIAHIRHSSSIEFSIWRNPC